MADSKISALPDGSPLAATDFIPVAQDQGGGLFVTIKSPISDVATAIATEVSDDFVNITGDTMTGPLGFEEPTAPASWTVTPGADGSLNIVGSTYNQILTLNPGTSTVGNTGQTIAGRFRYSMPIVEVTNVSEPVKSGGSGATTALLRVNEESPVSVVIRANVADLEDFDAGNFFSVMQEGAGQVSITAETADVVLRVPAGVSATTRAQYSIISATLYDITGDTQTWVISGDLGPPV